MTYCRKQDSETWHFCKDCSDWPQATDYQELYVTPRDGEFCTECETRQNGAYDLEGMSIAS